MVDVKNKKETIKSLEKMAAEVLQLKQEREQRRPLLIEFCGSPKSGKTTTITSLNIFLKRNGFNTVILTERASVCPIVNKTHPFFNIWTLTSAISEIIKNLEQGKDKIDIIISDRGIFDALCWFEWLNTNPTESAPYLDTKTYNVLKEFIKLEMWTNYLDLIYVFQVKPETSIIREYAHLLTEKRGSIMRESVLEGFNKSINTVIHKHGQNFRDIQKIHTDTSTTNNDPNTVSFNVTQMILSNLKNLLIEKVGYVTQNTISELLNKPTELLKSDVINLRFESRNIVEEKNLIQPIAIAVITNPKRTKVLVVKKSNKRTSVESPEKDKLLLYIGGHVRQEDKTNNDNFLDIIKKTLHREIQEEIGESISIQSSTPFIIYTPISSVSKRHFAICYIIEMDLEDKKFKLTSDEFIMKTGTSKSGHIININEAISDISKLESWSLEILKKVFNMSIPENLYIKFDQDDQND